MKRLNDLERDLHCLSPRALVDISPSDRSQTPLRNVDCNYSSAYVTLLTNFDLMGHGMTFTIGRGNDIVCLQTAPILH